MISFLDASTIKIGHFRTLEKDLEMVWKASANLGYCHFEYFYPIRFVLGNADRHS